ncbi:MAG: O-antigen ligase family protein, partial [Actinomycetota bacterium]|nr:O-antigen ligase family protein [Actinomycetota bacterium]
LVGRGPRRCRIDALDVIVVAFLALSTIYLLIPSIVGASASSFDLRSRALGWRSSVLYVVAFLALRHLRLGREVVDRILRRVLIAIVVTAVIGIFEAIFSSTWNHLAVNDLGVTNYRHVVLGQQPGGLFHLNDIRSFGTLNGHEILRIGSVLFDYVSIGFVFAIGLGIAAELTARAQGRPWAYACMPILGAALLLTQTRSALVAAVVAVAFALRRRAGKPLAQRAHFGRVLAVVLLLLVPVTLATGALNRFAGDTANNTIHQSRARAALSIMVEQPLGRGLGTTGGGVSAADQSPSSTGPTVIATESQYLLVGTQLGWAGAVLYAAITMLAAAKLMSRRGDDATALAPGAMSNVAVGVALGAVFTQPFVTIEVAFLFWGLLGLAVSVADDGAGDPATDVAAPGELVAVGEHA